MDYWDMRDTSGPGKPHKHPLVYAICGVMAAALCTYFSTDLWRGLRTLRWPATRCVIEKAEISWTQVWTGTHFVSVRFRYDANGRTYVGTRFRGIGDCTDKRENIARFVVGQPATCFINPKDHAQAVLRKDIKGEEWFMPVSFGFSALVLFGGVIWEVRLRCCERLDKREEGCPSAVPID